MEKKFLMILILITYIIFSSLGMVIISSCSTKKLFSLNEIGMFFNIPWKLLVGLFLYLVSFILWIYILQLFPVSYISPVSYGLVFIFILIFSTIFLNSAISIKQILGAILIILGVLISSIK